VSILWVGPTICSEFTSRFALFAEIQRTPRHTRLSSKPARALERPDWRLSTSGVLGSAYYPGGLFWLAAEQDDLGIHRQLFGMLKVIHPDLESFELFLALGRDIRNELREALEDIARTQPVLFVIDNVPHYGSGVTAERLSHYCPAIGVVTVLVTSRNHIGDAYVRHIPIDALARSASVTLLTNGVGVRSTLSEDEWADIAAWVGDLPLVLELLNKSLSFKSITPLELLSKSRTVEVTAEVDRQMRSLVSHVPAGSLRGVTEALAISYDTLSSETRRAAGLLAFCAAERVPMDLFNSIVETADASEVRAALIGRSVLTSSGKAEHDIECLGTMHRVMADYVRSRVSSSRHNLVHVCNAIASVMTQEHCADPTDWLLMNACLPHADAAFWRAVSRTSPSRCQASMVETSGDIPHGILRDD